MNKNKIITQIHHVQYEPEEIIVKILKGEHYCQSLLNRRTKNISTGFLHCLLKWVEDNMDKAVEFKIDENDKRQVYENKWFDRIKKEK